jgi:hypothetical protein
MTQIVVLVCFSKGIFILRNLNLKVYLFFRSIFKRLKKYYIGNKNFFPGFELETFNILDATL